MLQEVQGTIIPRRPRWYEKAKGIETFHIERCRADRNWSIRKTAKELELSSTSVWDNLYLARGLRVYPDITRFRSAKDAEKYIFQKDKRKRIPWVMPKD